LLPIFKPRHYPALLISGAALLAVDPGRARSAPLDQTLVSVFQPAVPKGPTKSGNCWTDSIAVDRRGAWRCMAGNEIYDPCFEVPGLRKAVVCGASPATKATGFVLELTGPLPKPSDQGRTISRPWLLKLSDRSICEIETGTIAQVSGLDVPYDCSDSHRCADDGTCPYMTGLTPSFHRGKIWTAEKVAFSAGNGEMKLLTRERIEVVAVWN
jgi:hypothetical protein